jgi:hypothetical protein
MTNLSDALKDLEAKLQREDRALELELKREQHRRQQAKEQAEQEARAHFDALPVEQNEALAGKHLIDQDIERAKAQGHWSTSV